MTEEVNEKFDSLLLGLDKNDQTYLGRKYYLDSQREQDLDSIKTMEEKKKRSGEKRAFHDIGEKSTVFLNREQLKWLLIFAQRSVSELSHLR